MTKFKHLPPEAQRYIRERNKVRNWTAVIGGVLAMLGTVATILLAKDSLLQCFDWTYETIHGPTHLHEAQQAIITLTNAVVNIKQTQDWQYRQTSKRLSKIEGKLGIPDGNYTYNNTTNDLAITP